MAAAIGAATTFAVRVCFMKSGTWRVFITLVGEVEYPASAAVFEGLETGGIARRTAEAVDGRTRVVATGAVVDEGGVTGVAAVVVVVDGHRVAAAVEGRMCRVGAAFGDEALPAAAPASTRVCRFAAVLGDDDCDTIDVFFAPAVGDFIATAEVAVRGLATLVAAVVGRAGLG